MTGRLENKVAVITGATSGIGEATARRFHAEGALVVLAGRSDAKGRALAAELGAGASFVRTDVLEEAEVEALISAAVDQHGRLDCLFNNAGGPAPGDFETCTPEQLDYAMRLLVGSVLWGIKHAVPHLRAGGGGSIINNSSIAALRLGQGPILYSAAKAAVTHLTRMAGAQLGGWGIRVNSIAPGAIATPIFWGGSGRAQTLSDEENAGKQARLEESLARATPLPRSGFGSDIAAAAVLLASDEGSFINAHDLVVDGGRIAMWHEA